MTISLPRPPRDPDFKNPQDVARWTRDLREYLNQVAAKVAEAALELADAQPLSPTLTALDNLSASAGLIEQTGADTFTKRTLGVGASTSVPTRNDADLRYVSLNDGVKGPASATDNAIARFDATTGKLVQNSPVTIDDNGVLAGFRYGSVSAIGVFLVTGYIDWTDAAGNARKIAVVS